MKKSTVCPFCSEKMIEKLTLANMYDSFKSKISCLCCKNCEIAFDRKDYSRIFKLNNINGILEESKS